MFSRRLSREGVGSPSSTSLLANMSVARRLAVGFGLVLVLTAVMGVVGVTRLASVHTQAVALGDSADSIAAVEAAVANIDDVVGGAFELLLDQAAAQRTVGAERARFLRQAEETAAGLEDEAASFSRSLDELGRTNLDADERDLLAQVKEQWTELSPLLSQTITDARAGRVVQAAAFVSAGRFGELTQTMSDELDRIVTSSVDGARADEQASERIYASGRTVILGLLGLSLLLGMAGAWVIARSIVQPLGALEARLREISEGNGDLTQRVDESRKDEVGALGRAFNRFANQVQEIVRQVQQAAGSQQQTAQEMASAAEQTGLAVGQIASTIEEVARGASQQAEGTQRVTSTVEAMSRAVSHVAEGGQAAASAAQQADEVAAEGAQIIGEANEAMERITVRVEDAAGVVASLGEKGQAIGEIVSTIDEIAAQTNLLALNAAIEAARAGELGRGFAVVADEVRQLAEQSQTAVASIGEIVHQIQTETQRAVEAMNSGRTEVHAGVASVARAHESFAQIRTSVERVAHEVAQVAAAAEQLDAGARQVQDHTAAVASVSEENAAATEEVSASTEQTSAATQEVAASAGKLSADAEHLAQLVARFRV